MNYLTGMRRLAAFSFALTFLTATSVTSAHSENPSNQNALIRRGEYLTHSVAMCVQCHSPRDAQGNIIVSQEFHGAPFPLQSPQWASTWAYYAINLRGLPGWNKEEVMHILQTGERFDGSHPHSPMPPFRMSHDDAEAIVTYLKSLQ